MNWDVVTRMWIKYRISSFFWAIEFWTKEMRREKIETKFFAERTEKIWQSFISHVHNGVCMRNFYLYIYSQFTVIMCINLNIFNSQSRVEEKTKKKLRKRRKEINIIMTLRHIMVVVVWWVKFKVMNFQFIINK